MTPVPESVLQGTAHLELANGDKLAICYRLRELEQLETAFGEDYEDIIAKAVAKRRAGDVAKILAIGLSRHHPKITEDAIRDLDCSWMDLQEAILSAYRWCIMGNREPAAAAPEGEGGEDPLAVTDPA